MTFDRADFTDLNKLNAQQRAAVVAPQLHMIRQGAVVGHLMTGVPAWDSFLAYLQGAIDTTEGQFAALQSAMNEPDVLDEKSLLRLKVDMLRCRERIAAWKATMQLPKELIELGDGARDLLSRMESDDAND